VGWPQALSGLLLVAAILAVAALLAVREIAVLRRLSDVAEDERRRLRRRAYRRLVGCVLLFALAVLLAGGLLFLEGPVQRLIDLPGFDPNNPSDEQRQLARIFGWYWVAVLLILLAVVLLAGFDLWAVRREAIRERRRLIEDRRADLEAEAALRRYRRNGDA
jgi:hypothetical protein